MKKKAKNNMADELRPEYDLRSLLKRGSEENTRNVTAPEQI